MIELKCSCELQRWCSQSESRQQCSDWKFFLGANHQTCLNHWLNLRSGLLFLGPWASFSPLVPKKSFHSIRQCFRQLLTLTSWQQVPFQHNRSRPRSAHKLFSEFALKFLTPISSTHLWDDTGTWPHLLWLNESKSLQPECKISRETSFQSRVWYYNGI